MYIWRFYFLSLVLCLVLTGLFDLYFNICFIQFIQLNFLSTSLVRLLSFLQSFTFVIIVLFFYTYLTMTMSLAIVLYCHVVCLYHLVMCFVRAL